MKRLWLLAVVLVLVVSCFTPAFAGGGAEARDSGAVPSVKANGEVFISGLPPGAKVVRVEVYDDLRGIPTTPSQSPVMLKIGAGFNYEWADAQGVTSWQLVTENSKVGFGLKKDCSWKDAAGIPRCKYVRVE